MSTVHHVGEHEDGARCSLCGVPIPGSVAVVGMFVEHEFVEHDQTAQGAPSMRLVGRGGTRGDICTRQS